MILLLYTRRVSAIQAISGVGHWDDLWSDHQFKDKKKLKENVQSLTLHRDTYLQDIHKGFSSLTKVGDALSPLHLHNSIYE